MNINYFFLLIAAYLIGSFSMSIFIAKRFFNVDIRSCGSGNAGTTNMLRTLGKKCAIIVFLCDCCKGALVTSFVFLLPHMHESAYISERMVMQFVLGLSAVAGHIFPIYYGFRGGKGVATLLGVVVGIQPLAGGIVLLVFITVLLLTRYVSLSSMAAASSYPIVVSFFLNDSNFITYPLFACLISLLLVLTHIKNIQRLITGNESRIKIKKIRLRRRRNREH